MNNATREQNERLRQKLKALADECFSVTPDWNELMMFLQYGSEILEEDADEWYDKTLWQDKRWMTQ